MPLVPASFELPAAPATDEFLLTPLRVDHLVLDYDAVMSSRERLWGLFGAGWGWPQADLSLTQDLVDLGWHHKEFQRRSSFAYIVLTPDGRRALGCCYIERTRREGFDAEAMYWARGDRIAAGLEERLGAAFRAWLANHWPFRRVAFPGRDQPW